MQLVIPRLQFMRKLLDWCQRAKVDLDEFNLIVLGLLSNFLDGRLGSSLVTSGNNTEQTVNYRENLYINCSCLLFLLTQYNSCAPTRRPKRCRSTFAIVNALNCRFLEWRRNPPLLCCQWQWRLYQSSLECRLLESFSCSKTLWHEVRKFTNIFMH